MKLIFYFICILCSIFIEILVIFVSRLVLEWVVPLLGSSWRNHLIFYLQIKQRLFEKNVSKSSDILGSSKNINDVSRYLLINVNFHQILNIH